MAKVIPEEEKNYNKFPGEHVIVLDDVVTIGDKVFHLVHNYQDGFDKEKLEQRYSDIFAKHDYVVGDWGHEQLRLKGFFSTSRKKMPDDLKISHLEDYIKEYMNYGAAFFVLKRMRSKDIKREAPFLAEKVYEVNPTVSSETRPKKVVAKSQKRDVAQGASQARQSQSKQTQSKQTQSKQGQYKPVQTKQAQAKSTSPAKKRRPATQPTFVQKDKSEKARTPFVKTEDTHVSHETKATKRPAFVVRTRQK